VRTSETELQVEGVCLSGLLAEPTGSPRALVVALHGAGLTSGYFNAPSDPSLSLLELGAELGYMVWAPDRPGYGASAGLPDDELGLDSQVDLLHRALNVFVSERDVGAGCLLLGHSYGLKVAIGMAADTRGADLLGVEGSGSGLHYAFVPGRTSPQAQNGDRGAAWGPPELYPAGTFLRTNLPIGRVPAAQASEAAEWPARFRQFAEAVTIPIRFTFGEHERMWVVDENHFAALRALLRRSPRVEVHVQPRAGHNISLGLSARAYHLKALAFTEECRYPRG
jgi:pimeloyl-ACP methyl ester carboxylesterase